MHSIQHYRGRHHCYCYCSHLDHVLDTAVGMWLHDSLHPDQRLHVRRQSVRHQVELSVWRDEGDSAVVLEASEPHAPSATATQNIREDISKVRTRHAWHMLTLHLGGTK